MNKLQYTLLVLIATLYIGGNPLQATQNVNKDNPIKKMLKTVTITGAMYLGNKSLPQNNHNPNQPQPSQQQDKAENKYGQGGIYNTNVSQPFQNNTNDLNNNDELINTTTLSQTRQNCNVTINGLIDHNNEILAENRDMLSMLKDAITESRQKEQKIGDQSKTISFLSLSLKNKSKELKNQQRLIVSKDQLIQSLNNKIQNQAKGLNNPQQTRKNRVERLNKKTQIQESVIIRKNNKIQEYFQLNRQKQVIIDQQDQLIQQQKQEIEQMVYKIIELYNIIDTLKSRIDNGL